VRQNRAKSETEIKTNKHINKPNNS